MKDRYRRVHSISSARLVKGKCSEALSSRPLLLYSTVSTLSVCAHILVRVSGFSYSGSQRYQPLGCIHWWSLGCLNQTHSRECLSIPWHIHICNQGLSRQSLGSRLYQNGSNWRAFLALAALSEPCTRYPYVPQSPDGGKSYTNDLSRSTLLPRAYCTQAVINSNKTVDSESQFSHNYGTSAVYGAPFYLICALNDRHFQHVNTELETQQHTPLSCFGSSRCGPYQHIQLRGTGRKRTTTRSCLFRTHQ